MKMKSAMLAVLILINGGLCVGQNKAHPTMHLYAKPTKSHFKRGETVTLSYSLTNTSTARRLVGASPAIGSEISLEITGPNAKSVPWEGAVYNDRTPGVIELVLLFPTRQISGTTIIPTSCNPLGEGGYCLDKPGRYVATASYRTSNEAFGISTCDSLIAAGPYRSEPFEFWID